VGKHWKPGRKTVQLQPATRPSRIRREPLRLEKADPREERKKLASSREREMWGGIAGVLLFAAALVVITVGIAAATFFRDDPETTARTQRFAQCYNAVGTNCVLDGGTIYVAGQRIEIAGMVAPSIQDPRCPEERSRGIDAAMRLADLLNSGHVTVGGTFRDPYGRAVRKVQVNDEDVGEAMISAGLARKAGEAENYCTSA
jgi:endonuclease YncB( thermonuclease family)